MFKHGEYVLLDHGKVVRIEGPYDGMPELYIVCYVNWGGGVGYAKTADLLKGKRMTKKEWKAYHKKQIGG